MKPPTARSYAAFLSSTKFNEKKTHPNNRGENMRWMGHIKTLSRIQCYHDIWRTGGLVIHSWRKKKSTEIVHSWRKNHKVVRHFKSFTKSYPCINIKYTTFTGLEKWPQNNGDNDIYKKKLNDLREIYSVGIDESKPWLLIHTLWPYFFYTHFIYRCFFFIKFW